MAFLSFEEKSQFLSANRGLDLADSGDFWVKIAGVDKAKELLLIHLSSNLKIAWQMRRVGSVGENYIGFPSPVVFGGCFIVKVDSKIPIIKFRSCLVALS